MVTHPAEPTGGVHSIERDRRGNVTSSYGGHDLSAIGAHIHLEIMVDRVYPLRRLDGQRCSGTCQQIDGLRQSVRYGGQVFVIATST